MLNEYIPFDSGTAELEQAYLNDLALDNTIKNLQQANTDLDRLIDELRAEERASHAA